MPDQYNAKKMPIGELLSTTSPNIGVPEWQRNYSWDTQQVETFWQDLTAFSEHYPGDNVNDQEYFLGSIVIVNNGAQHILLDGQQRLATATILLSVIRDFMKEYRGDAATRTQQKYISDYDDAAATNSFKLTLNRYDAEFFRREIQEERVADQLEPEAQLASHRLIRKARKFFLNKFEEKYHLQGRGKPAFDWALRLRQVLTDHVSVVAVTSTDEDNAAGVFETLNDRGIGLSTPDLLRNLLLRRATEATREQIIDCWKSILEIEEDANVEVFLRHYWLSHNGDVKTRSLYREIKQSLTTQNTDSLEFSRNLEQEANTYLEIVTARDSDPDLQKLLQSIRMLGAQSLIPAVLSAYAVGDPEQKKRFLWALITLYVRHNVIGGLENSKLETVVFTVARTIRHTHDFQAGIMALRDLAPSGESFRDRFKTAQVTRRDSARYMLRELEHAKRKTQEVAVETPDRVHVEHIYPLEPQEGQRWANHNSEVNRLGNLTLLSARLNQQIRNSPFTIKRPYYEQSDILLTSELRELESWDAEHIESRQEMMSGLAAGIWKFLD